MEVLICAKRHQMHIKILLFALTVSISSYSQTIQNLYPATVPLHFSAEGEKAYKVMEAKMDVLYAKMDSDYIPEKLTPQELAYYDEHIGELQTPYWDTEGDGCSWYCGGGPELVEASSFLSSHGEITYEPGNAHDFSYKNAWAEGVPGNGVGEYLVYHFQAGSPRITSVFVANGYVKSQTDWENNGRPKKLKLYFNDKAVAILHMENCRCEQSFDIALGYDPDLKKEWTLKFEIMEVYPGKKYEDTVISEIFFDGIDVH